MPNQETGPQPTDPKSQRSGYARHEMTHPCQICGNSYASHTVLPGSLVRDNIAALITARQPSWDPDEFICRSCLNRFRAEFVRSEMGKDRAELSTIDEKVLRSLHDDQLIADKLNQEYDRSLTFAERISDKVAEFGGSWRFIILFFGMMIVWVTANSIYLLFQPFDPYPYILLNLVLSLLGAVQAPIILMSQNRQEVRDRIRAENGYKVNLKTELEVRAVAEKLDRLIHHQWAHLLEIQQIQIEMIEDMTGRRAESSSHS